MLTVDVPVLDTDMLPARFAILVANTSSLSKAYVSVNVEITESPAPVTSGFSIGKAFICYDDMNLKSILKKIKNKNFYTYGKHKKSNFQIPRTLAWDQGPQTKFSQNVFGLA